MTVGLTLISRPSKQKYSEGPGPPPEPLTDPTATTRSVKIHNYREKQLEDEWRGRQSNRKPPKWGLSLRDIGNHPQPIINFFGRTGAWLDGPAWAADADTNGACGVASSEVDSIVKGSVERV